MTAPETNWALNLPSYQSLGTCLQPLPPRQLPLLLQQEYKAPNLNIQKALGVSESVALVIQPRLVHYPETRDLTRQPPKVIHLYTRRMSSATVKLEPDDVLEGAYDCAIC